MHSNYYTEKMQKMPNNTIATSGGSPCNCKTKVFKSVQKLMNSRKMSYLTKNTTQDKICCKCSEPKV